MKGCPEGGQFVLLLQERLDSADQASIVGHVEALSTVPGSSRSPDCRGLSFQSEPHSRDACTPKTSLETRNGETERRPSALRDRPDWPPLPTAARRLSSLSLARDRGTSVALGPRLRDPRRLGRGGWGSSARPDGGRSTGSWR